MADGTLYVYGVSSTSDFDPTSLEGVEGAQVGTVEHEGLVALTSRLQGDTLAARDLRAHWRVLEDAFKHTTVLPVRFGTVLEDEHAVREQLLEPNQEWLSGQLAELTGLAQLNLTGRYDEDALLREIVRTTPVIAQLRKRLGPQPAPAEQFRLGQLVEAEVAGRRAADTDFALSVLEPFAVAVQAEEVAHPAAFSLAFLVKRETEADFSDAVGGVRERLSPRVEIRYVGPLPPFSFAETDLTSGRGAWG